MADLTHAGAFHTARPSDKTSLALLGGTTYRGVAFTTDQTQRLHKWLGMEHMRPAPMKTVQREAKPDFMGITETIDVEVVDGPEDQHPLLVAGRVRNALRATEHHGLRVMAFMADAGLLEEGADPVRVLWGILRDMGFDVDGEDGWEDDEL